MPNDLTFQQLANAAPAGAISLSGDDVVISASLLTGDTIDALSASGVVEFCIKLLGAAEAAQTTANTGVATGSRLNSFFSTFSSVSLSNSGPTAQSTRSVTGVVPLNVNEITGTTI